MRHKILFGLFAILTFTACGGEDEPTVDPVIDPITDPDDPTKAESYAERTVLVYMAGENSLSRYTQADYSGSDYNELLAGIAEVDNANSNLVVYVDNTDTPRLVHLTKDASGNVVEESVKEYDEQDSADAGVMASVFKDAFDAYPSNSYGLVLWSHGEGWIPKSVTKGNWFGVDNNANTTANSGSYMDIPDLATALSQTVHFDFILFDACFMLSAEVLYELKSYADYFVGSPAEIPGPGMRYDLITPLFFSADTDYVVQIARSYFESYEVNYDASKANSDSDWTAGVAIGAVKAAALPELATATAHIVNKYVTDESGPVYSTVMCYDPRSSNQYYHDLKDFIHQETGTNTADYTQWLESFDKAMVYWGTTPTLYSAFGSHLVTMSDYTGGLSIFIPRLAKSNLLTSFHKFKWYTAAGWDRTGW